jgi:hypothetical protein
LPECAYETERNREHRAHEEMCEDFVAVLQRVDCCPYYKCNVQQE